MAEMQSLFQQDIPADRKLLLESFTNLQKVAEYCENNYIQAQDKTKALEETKAYAAQSLASVASQINGLAEKVFKLLDLQASELSKMESSVNFISQKVEMHKEKVARREIGAFAVAKTTPRMTKIIPPANPVQREKYTRKPIIYTLLDDTGHGVKEVSNHPVRVGTLSRRYGQSSMTSSTSQGTLGRSAKGARPVQPPVVPSAYSSPVTNSPSTEGPPMHSSDVGRNRNSCGIENMVMPVSVPVSMLPPPPAPAPAPAPSVAAELGENDLLDMPPPPPMELPPPPAPPPQIFNEVCLPPPPPLVSDPPLSASSASGCHNHFMWQGPRRDHSATPPASLRCRCSASSPALLHPPVNDVSLSSPLSICSPAPILPSLLQFIPQIPLTGFVARFQENITDCPPPPPPPDFMVDLNEMTPPPPPPIDYLDEPQWIPPNYIEKVVALYAYDKRSGDDLTFQEGEIIYVIAKSENGWYEGVINGVTGFFPSNYVQCLD
ncbi:abl interactor 1-like isoform X1 [Chiloscyllium plagiosum]|uniref:abl interactor 1-like isoform X1 n=1 Tax=Chiloscyllium plagiosum TaxID=36176 RepID=UPI001CB822D7|nr:abl interactor 1-like isoform X1 [Chiloscyllium plagiosum]